MNEQLSRNALRADAIFDALMGALLILAPSRGLYERLDLPSARPELFTQLAGGLLLAFALLLWEAPEKRLVAEAVGRAACIANALGVVILPLWLLSGEVDIGVQGKSLLWAVTVILAAFAILEARYLRASR